MPAVSFLSQLKAGGKTDYLQVAREFASAYPQRGLVIIVSDFLDSRDAVKPLNYLADFGHELCLVQIWTPEDREPQWDGEVELTDAETGDRLELALDQEARAGYTRAFDAYAGALSALAARTGGRYVGLPTTTQLEEAIFGALMRAGGVQ